MTCREAKGQWVVWATNDNGLCVCVWGGGGWGGVLERSRREECGPTVMPIRGGIGVVCGVVWCRMGRERERVCVCVCVCVCLCELARLLVVQSLLNMCGPLLNPGQVSFFASNMGKRRGEKGRDGVCVWGGGVKWSTGTAPRPLHWDTQVKGRRWVGGGGQSAGSVVRWTEGILGV